MDTLFWWTGAVFWGWLAFVCALAALALIAVLPRIAYVWFRFKTRTGQRLQIEECWAQECHGPDPRRVRLLWSHINREGPWKGGDTYHPEVKARFLELFGPYLEAE